MILKEIGTSYKIVSEKIDNAPPVWGANFSFIGFVVGLITMLSLFFIIGRETTPSLTGAIVLIGAILFGFIIAIISYHIPQQSCKCGIKISLVDNSNTLNARSFQITEDPDKDALKIKEIVSEFEEIANRKVEYSRQSLELSRAKEKECCDKYKNVIDKVRDANK